MAVTLDLYNITDPANCANKSIPDTSLKTITGNPIEDEEILNPTFLINYFSELLSCNYCKVTYPDQTVKYYFVTVTTENGNNLRIDCTMDYLMTYWDEIKNTPMTVVRSTSFGKPTYVIDNLLPVDNSRVITKVLPFNTIHTDEYVVINTL